MVFNGRGESPLWCLARVWLEGSIPSRVQEKWIWIKTSPSSKSEYGRFRYRRAPLLISRVPSLLSFLTSVEWLRSSPIFETTSTFAPSQSLRFAPSQILCSFPVASQPLFIDSAFVHWFSRAAFALIDKDILTSHLDLSFSTKTSSLRREKRKGLFWVEASGKVRSAFS